MDDKQVDILAKKLDSITKLLAFSLVKDKPVIEQVEILTKAGLRVVDIAALLDKTENQIYVTQTLLRKKKKEQSKETTEQQTSSEVGQNV